MASKPKLKKLIKLAEKGHADSQNKLGAMYAKGTGLDQDYAMAVMWWRKAAEKRHVDSQYKLGYMYENGHGVAQDYSAAVMWYSMAADQEMMKRSTKSVQCTS